MPPLTAQQRESLTKALASAFPAEANLQLLVQFKLGIGLNSITAPAIHDLMVLNVINWAAAHGSKLTDLIVGALNMNPENPDLRSVAADFGLDGGAGEFEAIVLQSVPLTDVETWRERMMASERAVCRVDTGEQGIGTGFLVGTSLVVTNYHVISQAQPSDLSVRFDYKQSPGGKTVQEGVRYRLVAGAGWLAASSPVGELDYAVLRVDGKPAESSVASQPGAPKRGFLSPKPYEFQTGDPLFIIQHPQASPLKFAPGSVDAPSAASNRVTYTVNTEKGSSGSPCFTSDWTVAALHHWGGPQHNRGVKFSAILPSWQASIGNEVGH